MKLVKKFLSVFFILLILPLYILYFVLATVADKDSVFSSFAQFFSLIPGKLGSYIRTAFFNLAMTHCDTDLVIGFGVLFSHQDTELLSGCYIGHQSNIGKCRIEENCLLGSGVHIMSGKGQHNFDDLNTPLIDQGGTFTKVKIGEDTWIGNGSLIMANVGKKCIVGAGSVVINDIPDYSIVAGNPAKVIKSRKGN
ncbi:acyltransferase [Paraglaciecola aquimarina]|uniref:Acyltransferase n=1 Tax=Paraglaciecola algarum TaxID=3050085 RepID=A0ABS9D4S3_9ALTE|nr:acyltransferase [Paraglaciecola sp. G1-23]MCF2947770.1 acyltransferase [Paraglaciecola sp. G1-23]